MVSNLHGRSGARPLAMWLLLASCLVACVDDPAKPQSNQAPLAAAPIANQTISAGDTVAIDLSSHFSDPNGHPLVFETASAHAAVVTASVSGSTLTLTAVGRGIAAITVTARDPGGLSATQSFSVTVPNQPPIVTDSIPAAELSSGARRAVELHAHFRDPDGDTLRFSVVTSDESTVSARVSQAVAVVTAVRSGRVEITITAEDPARLSASEVFEVTVPNTQPVITKLLASPSLVAGGEVVIDLANHFTDPDDDALRFLAETNDPTVVTASVTGEIVTLKGLVRGGAEVTVIARDPVGLSVSQTFRVTVWRNADAAALAALYQNTGGPRWKNSDNWLSEEPLEEWHGVTVGSIGRVVGLRLVENRLKGSLPPELHQLSELGRLDLGFNSLSGTIPPELGLLKNLTSLGLSNNELSGSIPTELGLLSALVDLVLYDNNLTGPIPPELGNLRKLVHLLLGGNELTGTIPAQLGGLDQLAELSLADNHLTGPVPPQLGNIRGLTRLRLSHNELTGQLPAELGNLVRLEDLELRFNRLAGQIPPELGGLSNLTSLWLDHNALTGPIPPELGSLSGVTTLWLHENELTGPVPPELGGLPASRIWLSLYGNRLTGPLPRSLLQIDLRFIDASRNDGLCVPGTALFAEWNDSIGAATNRFCNDTDVEVLTALHESTGGSWTNSDGWLASPVLDRWYGVVADSLGRVLELDLADNGLAGRLPVAFGGLDHMTSLRIDRNALTGPLPASLTSLPLREFLYSATSLCVPSEPEARAWLDAIEVHRGTGNQCPPLSDREILELLYRLTGGDDWDRSDNWLTGAPLRNWWGVSVDDEGRVKWLVLAQNGLTGALPVELAQLAKLTKLDLSSNELEGPIPSEFGGIRGLQILDLSGNSLSGLIPPEIGNIESLYWLQLNRNTLNGPIPPELGSLDGLGVLYLDRNTLSGPIPPELAGLRSLRRLDLGGNLLSGPIPPELGSLDGLTRLSLYNNALSGPIPPELGSLEAIRVLSLSGNALSGSIPPEFGGIRGIRILGLSGNALSGNIPPEFGRLVQLERLWIGDNTLSGPIPPEMGRLVHLQTLELADNDLSGPVPPALANLREVRELDLSGNTGLSGRLPWGLNKLRQLEALGTQATGLCAPDDPAFRDWLTTVANRVPWCTGAQAVLTQAVQSRELPVPLVAGEEALLRVFVEARRVTDTGIPPVNATFFLDGREVHTARIPAGKEAMATSADPSSLARTPSTRIPAHVVEPGLEMVVEVDPQGALDPSLGVTARIPETGRLEVDVRAMPPLDLTLVPFLWSEEPDSAVLSMTTAMAADPQGHELLWETNTLLPVREVNVSSHEPVLTSTNDARRIYDEVYAIRVLEGKRGHYMGMMSGSVTRARGLGSVGGRTSFSVPNPSTIAHELGHNFGLLHAPCGSGFGFSRSLDPLFPTRDGSVGAWGFDFRGTGQLVHPDTPDLMSYCRDPHWISEYGFNKALEFRLDDEARSRAMRAAAPSQSLLVWGGTGPDGSLFLEPAFRVVAGPVEPNATGDYHLEGTSTDGSVLFSYSFPMSEVGDGEGARAFAFALPMEAGWVDGLDRITLSGPGAAAVIDQETNRPVTILIDRHNGQVRGILRDLPGTPRIQADGVAAAFGSTIEVLFSRGIP